MTPVRRRAAPRHGAITAGTARKSTPPAKPLGGRIPRWPRGATICGIAALAICGSFSSWAWAEKTNATSSRFARDEAVRAIPWRQLAPPHRRAAQRVVNNPSIYRRLPTRIIDCDPELFTFLVRHPEVVIDVWRVMGISQVALERLPAGNANLGSAYRGTDGAGTSGTVRFLYADWGQNDKNLAVVFADGAYEGRPLATPIKAQSVLLLRSAAVQETNGRHYVTVRIDSFVRIEQVGVELIAKTIQPWISKTADYNFIETLTFVSNFSRAAERNPQGIERLATRLPNIDDATRNELIALSYRTAERYAVAHAARPLLARRDVATNH
jgi:hypothetical protein